VTYCINYCYMIKQFFICNFYIHRVLIIVTYLGGPISVFRIEEVAETHFF